MRRCFYHTDLRQNAVFHNVSDKLHSFNIQNRTKHAWAFSKTVEKISKITYTASRLSLKVARYSLSGSIPPKFERKLQRHKQRLGKINTTVVLDKDENLL